MRAGARHAAAWLLAALIAWTQPWGRVAADTKHDLAADPWGFLAGAASAYTDVFTLGQIQNQAYGYLWPQGLFFALTDFLPDWVAQRCWWTLVVGVGFSGMLVLLGRLGFRDWGALLPAAVYVLSPRTLTTLTAISSETWPVMLAPWVVAPLIGARGWPALARSLLAVACMGAVNATATIAACVPAAMVLLWSKRWRGFLAWGAGCVAVSAWWIGPLLVMGRFAAPFTEFIESATVTTAWTNPVEVLRGVTHWTPFVDTERAAGHLLVTSPVFVVATIAVAAVGLVGVRRRPMWVAMLALGLIAVCALPIPLLDGPLAAFRNVHKFDPLIRLPLAVGFAAVVHGLRPVKFAAGVAVVAVACAPAWTGHLLPEGHYAQVPAYWQEAADFINEHGQDTRTLIVPPAPFARQDWGWTRDEVLQPLLDVPWATRDAVPLIAPEAIRGLDGLMAVLAEDSLPPEGQATALTAAGFGILVLREDIPDEQRERLHELGDVHRFGEVDVVVVDPGAGPTWARDYPTVAGGEEAVALVRAITGTEHMRLADLGEQAHITTDTPLLVARNYGSGDTSAPLAHPSEGADVANRVADYPSHTDPIPVTETGGHVRASSSAADATSFGGPNPGQSLNALADGNPDTAWWPTAGTGAGEWIEVEAGSSISITATDDTTVLVGDTPTHLRGGIPRDVPAGRITLTERVGIAEVSPLRRVIEVEGPGDIILQDLLPRTGHLHRIVTAHGDYTVRAPGPVTIDGREVEPGASLRLDGRHELRTDAAWVWLDTDTPAPAAESVWVTQRAAGPGLPGTLIDAHVRALPTADPKATVGADFAGNSWYRWSLLGGGALALLAVTVCAWVARRPARPAAGALPGWVAPVLVAVAGAAISGWAGLAAVLGTWAVLRWTTLRAAPLTCVLLGIAATWLARAPWPADNYAGHTTALALLGLAAVACAVPPPRRTTPPPPTSRQESPQGPAGTTH